ncbi:hypothetical protein EBB07_32125 [Paenibacillaceae bacterium]|nr:hypothetical protein EBB07_32125 [Paenibacillaceae bacterium]
MRSRPGQKILSLSRFRQIVLSRRSRKRWDRDKVKMGLSISLSSVTAAAFFTADNTGAVSAFTNDGPTKMPDDNLAGSLLWVIVALLIVIGMIVLFIKFLSKRSRSFGANRSLRTLGGISLGQNKSLQIVELAGRIYVVGVGNEVKLLDKVDDLEEAQAIIAYMEEQMDKSMNLSSLTGLIQKLRKRQDDKQEQEPGTELWQASSSFQDVLQDKLQRQSIRKQNVEAALKDAKSKDRLMDE